VENGLYYARGPGFREVRIRKRGLRFCLTRAKIIADTDIYTISLLPIFWFYRFYRYTGIIDISDIRPMRHLLTTADQLGQILRSARRERGLSQAQAGLRLGLSQSRLSELEQDAATVTVAQLLAMASLYGLQLEVATRASQAPTAW